MRLGSRQLTVAVLSAVLWVSILPGRVWAQNPSGSLRGQVTDPSGAAIPQTTVLAAPAPGESGVTKGAVTGNDGTFEVKNLAPGKYVVSAMAKGFAPYQQQDVTVVAGQAQ